MEKKEPIIVGYWYSKTEPNWPVPKENEWSQKEADDFVVKLEKLESARGVLTKAYKGFSTCRLCKCGCGSTEFVFKSFLWPDGLKHYVSKHRVKPPQVFIDFVG